LRDTILKFKKAGWLEAEPVERLTRLADGTLFPLFLELRAFLYIGALLVIAGVGATVKERVDLGPAAIVGLLSLGVAACFWYCAGRARPWSPDPVESPTAAFDYVLYLGCGLLGVELAYIEAKFKLLGSWWDLHLLYSGLIFLYVAYRCDNRLVLAMALADLTAWLGIRWSRFDFYIEANRVAAVLWGAALIGAGLELEKRRLKAHFTDTYLQLGVNLALAGMLSGANGFGTIWFWLLEAACVFVVMKALQAKRLAYFVYGAGYGYAGLAWAVSPLLRYEGTLYSMFFLVSAAALVGAVFYFRHRFEEKT
jgi:hypothetical protein